jgi:hypothetical protein
MASIHMWIMGVKMVQVGEMVCPQSKWYFSVQCLPGRGKGVMSRTYIPEKGLRSREDSNYVQVRGQKIRGVVSRTCASVNNDVVKNGIVTCQVKIPVRWMSAERYDPCSVLVAAEGRQRESV